VGDLRERMFVRQVSILNNTEKIKRNVLNDGLSGQDKREGKNVTRKKCGSSGGRLKKTKKKLKKKKKKKKKFSCRLAGKMSLRSPGWMCNCCECPWGWVQSNRGFLYWKKSNERGEKETREGDREKKY